MRAIGAAALGLASLAFLTGLSLLVVSGYCATYPLLRIAPRNRKMRAGMTLAQDMLALAMTFKGELGGTVDE